IYHPLYTCILYFFLFHRHLHPRDLHSFPTRRSSDLDGLTFTNGRGNEICVAAVHALKHNVVGRRLSEIIGDLRRFLRCLTVDKRSEEHTSELQSRFDLVCRLLLEKKKKTTYNIPHAS